MDSFYRLPSILLRSLKPFVLGTALTAMLYTGFGLLSNSAGAYANRLDTATQFPPDQHKQPAEQAAAPQQPATQHPAIEHSVQKTEHKPTIDKREELSKKLELRREEIKAEKKQRVKKQQQDSAASDTSD